MASFKVLHVVEASFAGVGRHVLDLAGGGAARGDVVDIAYGVRRADASFRVGLEKSGIRQAFALEVARRPGFSDALAIRELRKIVDTHGPYDIVHGHASKGGAYARLLPRSVRTVYTPNAFATQAPQLGRLARNAYRSVEQYLSRRTDGLVVVSPEEAAHARAIRLHPSSVQLIPNGIPLHPLPGRGEARAALGLDPAATVVGFVGRLCAQKGLDRLLDSFAEVHAATGAVLAVIGTGEDEAALHAQCERLGLGDAVRWLGRQNGQEAMPAFDVLAVPSRYEGFPYVVLEALWAGVPVVATDVAGAGSLLADGRAGTLCVGSPAELGRSVIELLGVIADPVRSSTMGAAARSIVENYSVDAMVDSTRAFYRRIAS